VTEHYDVIIVGTGAGGGTLAHTLAPSGKRILLLERGNFLPRETENWGPGPVFVDGKYISPDTWYDADGKPFQPQVHYFVGGATKLYGAALYRLRPGDFGRLRHADGVSPEWPLGYYDFEPWYTKAEWLYQVHGAHGEDPTEGHFSKQYPWPAVSHEPRIQQISDALLAGGYHPFHAPCGILLDEANRPASQCIRCAWCDGYPCLVHAKSDAEVIAVRPLLDQPNVTLLVNAEVKRLGTDAGGRTVTSVEVTRDRDDEVYEAEATGLYHELRKILNHIGMADHHILDKNFYMSMDVPVAGVAHQAGTCRFGTDPATSVLDVNCKAHELDNLYVVDTSFFPGIGAVNPALTAMANAIRVGEHLLSRMA
jgi:choline dehydrogenase-like flavoprotein